MKLPSTDEALFSLKSFAAAMLALYLAMRIGLPRPFWALMTAYIVAAPFAGPTRSKAVYRFGGTLLGALATVLIVPLFANSPELLSLALALWVGACLYVSLLDRTPRSYVLMLAGYTAGLIAFPAVHDPGTIFDIALARVEEILLGISCATLVHSLVFPQEFGPVLLARLDHALRDAQAWIGDALAPNGAVDASLDRRKLAGDITELRMMAVHLPFDTSHLRWTANAIHALQERLAAMVPLLSSIEDRLHALRGVDASARWDALLADIAAWTGTRRGETPQTTPAALRAAIDALTPAASRHADWRDLLQVNLAARLRALVDVCVDTQALRRHIGAGTAGMLPQAAYHLPPVKPQALHLDHGMALVSAAAAVIATLAGCAFWIATGWPAGAAVPMMAAVMSCFFATQDDPVPFIRGFLVWTIYSVPVSAFYLLAVLPAIHSFEMLVLACAPAFLLLGVLIARPATFGKAMPFMFGIAGTLALQDTNTADAASFINATLAQLAGLALAVLVIGMFRSVGAAWTARRLLRAGWRELAQIGQRSPSVPEFSARMVDRIALLTPRLALAGPQQDLQAADALVDLRIGLNMTQLRAVGAELGRSQAALGALLEQLARHFAMRPQADARADAQLLAALDNTLRSVSAAVDSQARQTALAALAGIRRDLFPQAAPYEPTPLLDKET
ncbi:FUSC family protein [Massilia sp. Leaf139]|uniref:FUSC family protein n=1 Tax=Massilia sp. Leaf139 TaxID=1736272 RepID=UPI0007008A00|nr:FUSC family protein [Massilia sp. Leaf139]KQQ88606.1 fusaric acid resistance protein [Massilia sp. Leaf139]